MIHCEATILEWLNIMKPGFAIIQLADLLDTIHHYPLTKDNFLNKLTIEEKNLPLFYGSNDAFNDVGWMQLDLLTYYDAMRERSLTNKEYGAVLQ